MTRGGQENSTRFGLSPLVSIITPTYNHERYIRECVESVLAQTYSNWEQIIIDDASTDGTGNIVSEFRDPRIRYYRQDHRGVFRLAETYNSALRLCRGELIAPLEGDDVWPPDRLAILAPAFADSGVVASYGVCRGFGDHQTPSTLVMPCAEVPRAYGGSALFNSPVGAVSYAMLRCGSMIGSATATIIRRSALESIGGFQHFPGLPSPDYPTFLELGLRGKFWFTGKTTSYWRKHANNTTTRQQQAILRGVFQCALDFVDRRRHESNFPSVSTKDIEEWWKARHGRQAFWEGRRLLFQEQWKAARARFWNAVSMATWQVRVGALCGMAASYLRLDLEPLMELAGRGYPAALFENDPGSEQQQPAQGSHS